MINKLLLVRVHGIKQDQNSTLLERAKMEARFKEPMLKVQPKSHRWTAEDGPSHYAFMLEGLTFEELKPLQDFAKAEDDAGVSLHNYEPGKIAEALDAVGLEQLGT